MRILLDAGPLLNFIATGEQNCLVQTAAKVQATLCVPDQVRIEVEWHADHNSRFTGSGASNVWRNLKNSGRVEVLSDDVTQDRVLAQELTLVSGVPAPQRLNRGQDLGEDLAIAHASALAYRGHDVILLIDETRGRNAAAMAKKRLEQRGAPGSITLTSSKAVLLAADPAWFSARRSEWAEVYTAMAQYDDGI